MSPSSPTSRRSRLSPFQKRLLTIIVSLGVLMLADTLYLLANRAADALGIDYFAVTDISLPRFYQTMVLSHTGVGIVLVVLALAFVEWHLPAVWRRHRKPSVWKAGATDTDPEAQRLTVPVHDTAIIAAQRPHVIF